MMIAAFEQGIAARSFSDSLIRNLAKTFFEVRERAVAHIEAEETHYEEGTHPKIFGCLS